MLKTVLKNLLLKKFSRVVVVYCSVIKVLCLCRSFQATAFIFYQKLFSLSRTFYFSLSLFSSFPLPSHATAYLGYHFQNSLSTTFLIYFSITSLIFKSLSFLPIKNVPPPRLLLSSVPLLFSLLFLSDECYLITAVFNCQCFLYISCNSDYSNNLSATLLHIYFLWFWYFISSINLTHNTIMISKVKRIRRLHIWMAQLGINETNDNF